MGAETISLPPGAVAALREHRRKQLELRMALGLAPMSPDNLSRDWVRACRTLGLPQVMFHALRHTHVSALIAANVDVVQISGASGTARQRLRCAYTGTSSRVPTPRRPPQLRPR